MGDVGDVEYAEVPHREIAAPSASVVLDCRILSEVIWMAHNAAENMEGRIVVGCKDSSTGASQRVQLIDEPVVADNGRVVVVVQNGWMEGGLWANEIGNPSAVVQRLAVCPTAGAELVGVIVGEDNPETPAASSAVTFEFRSYLKLSEIDSTKGATAAEVEVEGQRQLP